MIATSVRTPVATLAQGARLTRKADPAVRALLARVWASYGVLMLAAVAAGILATQLS